MKDREEARELIEGLLPDYAKLKCSDALKVVESARQRIKDRIFVLKPCDMSA